jgi:ABC-type transport system involved in multi-copper enzyme maturation permease subunit
MDDRVFDVGYRRHERRGKRQSAPWPIARTMLMLAWRRRSTKIALLMCAGVALVAGVGLVAQLLFQRFAQNLPMDTADVVGNAQEVLAGFVRGEFYFTAIALAAIAGGCVAEDRAAGAFELYFARPLTRMDYALGKLLGAGLVPTATLVLPALALWLAAVGISPPSISGPLWSLALPTLGGAVLGAVLLTTTIVGVSAIGQKARTVGVAYVAGLFVLSAIGEGLSAAGQDWAGYLVPERNLRTVVDALLEVGSPSIASQILSAGGMQSNHSVAGSLLGVGLYVMLGLGLLAWRLRAEVTA